MATTDIYKMQGTFAIQDAPPRLTRARVVQVIESLHHE
jgi:hypothetical protein